MSAILILVAAAWLALALFALAICRASAISDADADESPSQLTSESPRLGAATSIHEVQELGRRRPLPGRRPRAVRGPLLPDALPQARGHPPRPPRLIYRNVSMPRTRPERRDG
jgi:hypothetical protein